MFAGVRRHHPSAGGISDDAVEFVFVQWWHHRDALHLQIEIARNSKDRVADLFRLQTPAAHV